MEWHVRAGRLIFRRRTNRMAFRTLGVSGGWRRFPGAFVNILFLILE